MKKQFTDAQKAIAIATLREAKEKYASKVKSYTIGQIVNMVKHKKLKLSFVQRHYVTKSSDEIIWAIVSGKGVPLIVCNKIGNILDVIDGNQRLTSILLYVTGATNEIWEGLVFNTPKNKTPTTLNMNKVLKNEKDDIFLDEETIECFELIFNGRPFSELPKEIRDMILNIKINFAVYDNLSLGDEADVYVKVNKGITPLKNIEIVKAMCSQELWDMIQDLGKELNLNVPGKSRLKVEQIVAELFSAFITSAYLNYQEKEFPDDKWKNITAAVLSYFSEDENKEEAKELFEEFKKSIYAFKDLKYFIACKLKKDRKSEVFDVQELRQYYYTYINKTFAENPEFHRTYQTNNTQFLNGDDYKTKLFDVNGKLLTYKDLCQQGTSNIDNVRQCSKILDSTNEEKGLHISSAEDIKSFRDKKYQDVVSFHF